MHNIVSVFAFLGFATMPLWTKENMNMWPYVRTFVGLIIAYIALYVANPKYDENDDVSKIERIRRLRSIWWLNIMEAGIAGIGVYMA